MFQKKNTYDISRIKKILQNFSSKSRAHLYVEFNENKIFWNFLDFEQFCPFTWFDTFFDKKTPTLHAYAPKFDL